MAAYQDWVDIDCVDNLVTEGNSYRLYITADQDFFSPETMKVYWTTEARTADESDYTPLNREGQASNGSQARSLSDIWSTVEGHTPIK